MSNKYKILFILIGLVLVGGLVSIDFFSEKKERIRDCNAIFSNEYNCLVEKKDIDSRDHGTVKIFCRGLTNDSDFVFYPRRVYKLPEFNALVNIGDTLVKQSGSSCFFVLNGAKRDSIIFNCEN